MIKPTKLVGFIMQISKKSQYGLRAMIYLAKNFKKNEPISLKDVSKAENIPFNFLEKIFLRLEKANLIKAKKGARGGYFLAKKPNKITPGDIVAVLEEDLALVHCQGCPMARSCTSQDVWNEMKESISNALSLSTLADLVKKNKK